jgi:hypothetical protein
MAIYRVQGPNGEIITIEGPDGANPDDVIAHAQTLYQPKQKTTGDRVKDLGKSAASLADTGLNMATGTLDYLAYPLARAFGRSPEQAQAETTSPKDIIGSAFGITQDPAYQSEASRRIMGGLGQGIEQYAVKPLTSATGLPEQDVNSMVNSLLLGAGVKAQPMVSRAGNAVAQGVYAAEPYLAAAAKAPIKAPIQFGKGVVEGLVNKEYNPATSSMVPLRDTYTPPAAAQRFMGEMPGVPPQTLSQLESQARPTSELVGGTTGRIAQAVSPKTAAGETLVPLKGQGVQAWGERVGRGVRTNPLQAMGEVGLTALTGIPIKTIGQGAFEIGARYLGGKTGFSPGFMPAVEQARGRAGIQAQQPQTPLLTNNPTVAGPVVPPTMYVAPEGVAGTNINQVSQAGAQQKYAPQPVAQPVQPVSPAQVAQQQAAAKITPAKTPEQIAAQEAIMAQIRARGQKQQPKPAAQPTVVDELAQSGLSPAEQLQIRAQMAMGDRYRAPAGEAPVTPVAPTALPNTLQQVRSQIAESPQAAEINKAATVRSNRSQGQQARRDLTQDVRDYTSVTKKNNKLSYDKSMFDELADRRGAKIDWNQSPDITKMGLAEGKKTIQAFVAEQLKTSK